MLLSAFRSEESTIFNYPDLEDIRLTENQDMFADQQEVLNLSKCIAVSVFTPDGNWGGGGRGERNQNQSNKLLRSALDAGVQGVTILPACLCLATIFSCPWAAETIRTLCRGTYEYILRRTRETCLVLHPSAVLYILVFGIKFMILYFKKENIMNFKFIFALPKGSLPFLRLHKILLMMIVIE
jgi:hypothetical protein